MKEQKRQFSPSQNNRKDDLRMYIESIREAVENRVQLTAAGVMETRRRTLGGQSFRFSRDRIR
ncbi:MAG: hypothetical protein UT92_C0019G0004 [Candidatus Curtissbacteria bacterium GW2011_GWA1_40_24]|uniref:Uncharacterized protein n=1 Tax=Candidatus Curtissbacteria bacterium GW2011_GWA1_40_24 TaxID=1618406 RepID=A0A0G0RWX4_9BACT|nr:MAG: hypothetical protein UT92_C0019G0004 [Candidatus Curtissbacteria bacterium GW2011_GWA1_40_24]